MLRRTYSTDGELQSVTANRTTAFASQGEQIARCEGIDQRMSIFTRCYRTFERLDLAAAEDSEMRANVLNADDVSAAALVSEDGELNTVTLDFVRVPQGKFGAQCECKRALRGHLCKHIAFVLMELESRAYEPSGSSRAILIRGRTDKLRMASIAARLLGAPATSQPKTASVKSKHAEASWESQLRKLEAAQRRPLPRGSLPEIDHHADRKRPNRLWYALPHSEPVLNSPFALRVYLSEQGPDGTWSVPVYISDVLDTVPTDSADANIIDEFAELCDDDDYESWSSYDDDIFDDDDDGFESIEIHEHNAQKLFAAIVATGRCVVTPSFKQTLTAVQPLTWEDREPWRLQLHAAPDTSGAEPGVLFTPRLERGGEVRPLSRSDSFFADGVMLSDNTVSLYRSQDLSWIKAFLKQDPIFVTNSTLLDFIQRFVSMPDIH
ncbi:MAG: hypothetical protein KDA92_17325, partial [Planctomycetales bacterium]|nr:hypothetical protein [Planctomycetales bacterium]